MFSLTAGTLNHLLTQSGWALQRVAKFSGKTARFNIAPFSFSFSVNADGTVTTSDSSANADAVCDIPPSLLPRLAMKDEAAFSQIQTSGDSSLLTEIFYLSRNLKWDAAEDICRITGDIAAERIVQLANTTQQQICGSTLNLTQAFAEYWTEERPLVAKCVHIKQFIHQVDKLRDDVARLEQRINRLSNK